MENPSDCMCSDVFFLNPQCFHSQKSKETRAERNRSMVVLGPHPHKLYFLKSYSLLGLHNKSWEKVTSILDLHIFHLSFCSLEQERVSSQVPCEYPERLMRGSDVVMCLPQGVHACSTAFLCPAGGPGWRS